MTHEQFMENVVSLQDEYEDLRVKDFTEHFIALWPEFYKEIIRLRNLQIDANINTAHPATIYDLKHPTRLAQEDNVAWFIPIPWYRPLMCFIKLHKYVPSIDWSQYPSISPGQFIPMNLKICVFCKHETAQ